MDWDLVLRWSGVAGSLVSALVVAVLWAARHEMLTRADWAAWRAGHETAHAEIDGRLADGAQRAAGLQASLEHLPTRGDLAQVTAAVAAVAARQEGLASSIAGLERAVASLGTQVQMLVQHEIQGERR